MQIVICSPQKEPIGCLFRLVVISPHQNKSFPHLSIIYTIIAAATCHYCTHELLSPMITHSSSFSLSLSFSLFLFDFISPVGPTLLRSCFLRSSLVCFHGWFPSILSISTQRLLSNQNALIIPKFDSPFHCIH